MLQAITKSRWHCTFYSFKPDLACWNWNLLIFQWVFFTQDCLVSTSNKDESNLQIRKSIFCSIYLRLVNLSLYLILLLTKKNRISGDFNAKRTLCNLKVNILWQIKRLEPSYVIIKRPFNVLFLQEWIITLFTWFFMDLE